MIMFFSGGFRSLSLMGIFFLIFTTRVACANDLLLASIYVDAGRLTDAVNILKKYEASDEDGPKINLLTGKIYLAIDKPEKALEFFEMADLLSIDNTETQSGIALCQLRLGKFAIAKRYADSIKRTDRDSGDPLYINGLIQARTGQLEIAVKNIEESAQRQPNSQDIAIAKAKFFVSIGSLEKAKAALTEFVSRQPEAASVFAYLSEVRHKLGDIAGAIDERTRSLRLFSSQGNEYQAQVMASWLEVNDPAFRVIPAKPEPPAQQKREEYVEKKSPDKRATAENAKFKQPINDNEQVFAVPQFPFPPNVIITRGSGFIVDLGRKVVTNRHVVEGGKDFAIRTGLGEMIKAKLVYISTTDDLAVLELDKPLPADRAIPSTNFVKPNVGRNIVVMGYPLWFALGEGSPSLTNGVVSKRTGLKDDQGTFQITAKVNKGNSGGPVFDMRGNLVGITVGKLDTKKINDNQGFIPEDVNFAIHVDRLPKMLEASSGDEKQREELNAEELYQLMIGKVVMVATYK